MSRRLIAAVLVALLAFAQNAALAHGVWHAYHAAHSDHSGQSHDAPALAHDCDFDAVFAGVLGTGAASAPAFAVLPEDAERAAPPAPATLVSSAPEAPRSRGPPALS